MSAKGGYTIIDIEKILRNSVTIGEEQGRYYEGIYDMFEKAMGYGKPIYINGFFYK